jgi:hypothetical protein
MVSQRAWEPHIASSIGYFCSLPLLYLCAHYRAPIPYLVGAPMACRRVVWSTIIASIADYILYFGLFRKQIFAHVTPGASS